MACEDALRIGIDDETEMFGGIQEDTVGGLGSDSRDAEQTLANGRGWPAEETAQVALESLDKGLQEGAESAGFDVEVASRANESG